MATLTVADIVRTGTGEATFASAAGGGDVFANDGNTRFIAINGSGGSITITMTTQQTIGRDGLAVGDTAPTVAAAGTAILGPFDPSLYNNTSGQVAVTYSGVTSLTVAAIKG